MPENEGMRRAWKRTVPPVIAALTVASTLVHAQADRPELRMIVVDTEAAAAAVQAGIDAGLSFDRLAREHSVDPSRSAGGYMGPVNADDLRGEFREALDGLAPGEVSAPTPLGRSFLLIQRLNEPDMAWMVHNQAGFTAFDEGRYADAIASLGEAVDLAEQLEPDRLAQSLGNLADVHRLEGNHDDAAPLYQRAAALYEASLGADHVDLALTLNNQALLYHTREAYARAQPLYERALGIWERALGPEHPNVAAGLNNLGAVRHAQGAPDEAEAMFARSLEIRERVLGPDHPDVAQSLNSLGDLHRAAGDFGEAETFFRRALGILERALGPDHPSTATSRNALGETLVQDALERFAELVSLSAFRDEEYEAARAAFARALTGAPVAEETYLEMADIFAQEDMLGEAELMLSEAAERFESREAWYHLGEQHVNTGAPGAALDAFQQAFATPGPPNLDPVVETQMRSFISRRIGDLHGDAGRYDEALAAYGRAFEIDPEIVESRLGRGVVYYRSGLPEEAIEEYRWVLDKDPDNVSALNRLAETFMSLGRVEEAAETAARALEIDSELLTPRLLGGRALVTLGRTEEGARLLEEYQALNAEQQARDQRTREIIALDRDAMARLLEGRHDDGVRMYREAVQLHPDVPQFYFKLGVALNKLGRHDEAVTTFLELIDLGLGDDFIVHKNLAEAYRVLGDDDASARHAALYLERRDAEMVLD